MKNSYKNLYYFFLSSLNVHDNGGYGEIFKINFLQYIFYLYFSFFLFLQNYLLNNKINSLNFNFNFIDNYFENSILKFINKKFGKIMDFYWIILNILVWTPYFGYDAFSTEKTRLVLVFLKNHFENSFGFITYFIFLKENKIRNKALNVTHNMKNGSKKNRT